MRSLILVVPVSALAVAASPACAQSPRTAVGVNAAAVQSALSQYRTDLGADNGNQAGGKPTGRREIAWDSVPAALTAPANLPGNYFNTSLFRGAVLSTPGAGFQVSAVPGNAAGTPPRFGNLNAFYPEKFLPSSGSTLFSPLGSTTTVVDFFVPGTTVPGLSRGFGAIFSDVDVTGSARIAFYGINDALLYSLDVPGVSGDQTFSFAGVIFDTPVVRKVIITSGTAPIGTPENLRGGPTVDIVALDSFVFGEPVPSPAGAALLGLAGLAGAPRRRR